jgi:hypothetical protein
VHDADLVTQVPPGPQHFVAGACAARDGWPAAVVGLAPVGADFLPAQTALRGAVTAMGHTSIYVEGAPGADALRIILARWLQLVLSRDPRRRRPFDLPDAAFDDEDTRNGGTR